MFTQFLSGIVGVNARIFGLPANWYVYLLGAFIAGFSVCMLNTVVNPMLTLLGGGGKRGNQYIQIGGTFNSLMATLTPMLVGALIGSVSKDTVIADVNPVLFMAMGVFALAFIILLFIPISNPETEAAARDAVSPWKYRHFVFGVIAIFVYVGIEVGIPGTLNYYLADGSAKGAGLDPATAATVAGFVRTYWFLMLIGYSCPASSAEPCPARRSLSLWLAWRFSSPSEPCFHRFIQGFDAGLHRSVSNGAGPALGLAVGSLRSLHSVMWASFSTSVEGLGKSTALASGIFMTMVVGVSCR